MTQEFIREAVTLVGDDTGIEIRDLRVVFTIVRSIQSFPNQCKLQIYNLNRETQRKFRKEFTRVILLAGYKGNPRTIFEGNIKNVGISTDGMDVITTLYAGDADEAFITATLAKTFVGNTSIKTVVSNLAASFPGVVIGKLDGLDDIQPPLRGVTIDGSSVAQLNKLSDSYGFDWKIEGNVFATSKNSEPLTNRVIVVSSQTGLLDTPQITEIGVNVTTLLNPLYVPRGQIKVDTEDQEIQVSNGFVVSLPRTDVQGVFPIVQVTHTGDTRGKSWTSAVETRFSLA